MSKCRFQPQKITQFLRTNFLPNSSKRRENIKIKVVLLENQSNVAVVVVVEGKQQICCGGVFKWDMPHVIRNKL